VELAGNLPSRVLGKAVHREVSHRLEVCGNAGRPGQGVLLSTLHSGSGAVEKLPSEHIELPPAAALQRPLLTKPWCQVAKEKYCRVQMCFH